MNENEFSEEDDEGSEEEVLGETENIFVTIEREYKTVLEKLQENDENVESAEAYTKLFENFAETYKNEKDLIDKTLSQADQITLALEQLDLMRSNADFDADIIRDLKNQLSNAKRIADFAVAREQQVQEIVENMRTQIVKLNTELELKSRISGDADEDMGAISKTREGFEREKQRMIDEITSLKQKLVNSLSYSEELERKNSAADLKTNELNNLLDQELTDSAKKQRQIETLEGEVAILKTDYEGLRDQLEASSDNLETSNKQNALLEQLLKEQKFATEKATKTAEIVQIKYDKVQAEYDTIKAEYDDTKEKYIAQTRLFKLKIDETNNCNVEMNKIMKAKEASDRKVGGLERAKYLLESEKEKMKSNVGIMERECVLSKKQAELDLKQIDSLSKEKEILHKNILRIQGAIDQHAKLIKIQEQSKRKLEGDVRNLHHELVAQKKLCFRLEKEKIKAVEGTLDLTQQIEDSMDDMKLKQQAIFDQKKIISELESRLKQQVNLFETVRIERNSFQKQFQDAVAEVAEFKFKLKIANHQTEQLKEDISTKEIIILKEENVLRKVNKEKDNLKLEVQAGLTQIQKFRSELEVYKEKEKTLAKHILIAESELKKHIKQIEQIMNDRDVIGAQLVRRNDEIGLLYDKINILEVTLHRGEYHYGKRLDDIRLLKLEIQKIRQERDSLEKCIANMTDLKHEVFQLERELAQERLKCRALEEELQHPLNIHRWRKLEGSDPQVVELLRKIQILQKRLLNQTSESIEREKQLKEAEQLYLSLRQMVSHQPGADVKTELVKTQRALALRGAKMKCLISELNMYETQATEFKMDVNKISKELKDTKMKYFKQKKTCETHSTDTKLPAIKSDDSSMQQKKFTGGGFKIQP